MKACQLAKEVGHNNLQIFGDSEIIIKTLNSNSMLNSLILNVIMQWVHFILIDCDSVNSYHILHNLNKMADFKANQGCLLPPGMLRVNEGSCLMHPIP